MFRADALSLVLFIYFIWPTECAPCCVHKRSRAISLLHADKSARGNDISALQNLISSPSVKRPKCASLATRNWAIPHPPAIFESAVRGIGQGTLEAL